MKKLFICLVVVTVGGAFMYSLLGIGARRSDGGEATRDQTAAAAMVNLTVAIPVNGNFRGKASGFSPALGWTLGADGGSAQVLPTDHPDKFALELRNTEGGKQRVLSVMFPVPAGAKGVDLHLGGYEGDGLAYVSLFDAYGTELPHGGTFRFQGMGATLGQAAIGDPDIPPMTSYAMIVLAAGGGKFARFRDVKLKFSGPITSSSTPMSPAMTVATTNAAPLAGPIAAFAPEAAVPIWCGSHETVGVRDRQFFDYQSLRPDEHFVTSLAFDQRLNFSLQESAAVRWRPCSYDPAVCELKLTHVNYDGNRKAMIDLRGAFLNEFSAATDVVLTDGAKTVTVHVIVPAPKR